MSNILRRLKSPRFLTVVAVLLLFDVFALCRAPKLNVRASDNEQHVRGDVDYRVERIMNIARERADRPFFSVRDRFLHNEHNPGLFDAFAEMFVRLGVRKPYPILLFTIFVWNLGFVLLHAWTYRASGSLVFAGAATLFTASTPFVLFHSASLHQMPYSFMFFNLVMYCFCRYLRSLSRWWLAASFVAYFVLCQSYWMFYVSTGLMIVALQHKSRRIRPIATAVMALAPMLAAFGLVAQLGNLRGGVTEGFEQARSMALFRSADQADYDEDGEFVSRNDHLRADARAAYPRTVANRIEQMAGVTPQLLGLLLLATLIVAGRRAWARHGWLIWVILASLAWHLLMWQHTVIHHFSAMYGFFAWAVIVGSFFGEIVGAVPGGVAARRVCLALAVPAGLWLFWDPYRTELVRNIANLIG